MIDWDKPIETLTGWPAKVITRDYKTHNETLCLIQIKRPAGTSLLGWHRQDGSPFEGDYPIRNVPVKREGWMAVYKGKIREGVRCSSPLYETMEECMLVCAGNKVAAYVKVEWEEYP